jgi:hypothetical protein
MRRATLVWLLAGLSASLLAFPQATPARTSVSYTWGGTWQRAEVAGDLILIQVGTTVTGHYTWNDGTGTVNGSVSGPDGTTLTGSFNETNYQGSFVLTLNRDGRSFSGSYTGKNKNTNGPISGPFNGTCVEGDCRNNGPSHDEVHVVAIQPDCQFHKGGTPADAWLPIEKDTILKGSDEISCDPDGAITIAFGDNSTVVVRNTTQLKIGSFFTEGGTVRTEILLKQGELAAKVNKSEATKSDFKIKSPTATISVRGTTFSVFADPVGKASITTVQQGVVEVDPVKPGLPTVDVSAGKQVEVTATAESPIAPLGQAGARAGVNREVALARVEKVLKRLGAPCAFSPVHAGGGLGIKPSAGGWLVSLLVAGGVKGWSTWLVVGSEVTPANALAKTIATGCKGVRSGPASGVHASVTFTQGGSAVGQAVAAPASANDFDANIDPHTGVIANAYWTISIG